MNSYGLVFGGEKTSHDSGNDITYNVVSGNDYTQVVIEGDEYILPKEAMQSDKVYDFVDKLPIEMLDEIKRSTNVFVQFPTLRQGDMVVCKNSVRNDDLHTISGTAKEIANYLQGLSACRMYAKGGYVEGGEVEDENEDSNIRFLTPMPPSKLNKTGIDSLAEIVGKDELREVMSGALYAGNKRIVATDAKILVVLENQKYPNSLKGTIKSLWNKVPQERLVGVNYPNWEVVVPQTEQYQTAELSIDDVLAYAYGGVLQGKKIIDEKDFNKYEKQQFKYVLRINIGNLEIFVDSLLLTRILRVFKANDVRRIVFHIGNSNLRPIKITTDKEHYGLIMPIMGGAEYTFLSQKIFYPISQKDFRRMTETYGNYLKEFAKMVEDRQNNEMPTEFEYLATLRPISQAHPKENLIRLEEGGFDRYGKAIYSKPLSLKQIQHFSFFPATEINMIGTKIYYYENYVADVKTDINSIYLSKDIGNGEIELEIISVVKFLEKIRSGEYRPINEMAEGGEISMNMPLLIRVLELAKEDVKEDKEIHFIAERLQSIADKGTLTMEDYDYISGLESNEKIQKLIAENDSNDSDLRFEQGGEIEDLISRGIVDLKMYDTTPKHAKEYGLQCLNPLFVQTICVSESKRLKGLGTKVLSYIEKYAIENGHDLIFGHITQEAKFTKDKRETFFCDIDMIKNWLHSNGYAINNENNDFHKVIQSNKLEGGGSVLLAPNGKPSNLTPEQWHLVRTPEFKAWFGDWEALENAKMRDRGMDEITLNQLAKNVSKVVDENGEPLVLYRGNEGQMGKYGFEFKLGLNLLNKPNPQNFGFFFTDDLEIAKKYRKVDFWDSFIAGSITSIFLNANKVLDITDFGHKIGQINFVEGLVEKGIKFDLFEDLLTKIITFFEQGGEYKGWGNNTFDYFDVFPELRDLFLANGYKAIIFQEISRSYFPYKVFVAFESNQIKLADGTNTTFDGNNPDIRFESGGEIEMPEKDEINPEQIRAEIEALRELLQVLEGKDRQTIQDEIEILKLALGELEQTKLLAPNGKPSNLTPEQWHLVRTPEFKAWFGDWENSPQTASKVVDENGEPLVVFREIKATEKNHFNTDFQNTAISVKWQTNLDEILTRKLPSETKVGDKVKNHDKSGIVTEINNGIFKIKYEDGSESSSNAFGLTFYGEKKPKKVLSAFLNIRILGGIEKLMVHSFGTQKDSGILSISPNDKNYFTFRSNQVKLADGTNTTFDGNNPDIRFESGGGVLLAPNGKPSNLTPEQWHLVRTPEFKAWFGDWEALENAKMRDRGMGEITLNQLAKNVSKVVDENGEPLVCNHSSREQDIDVFDGNRIFRTPNIQVKPIWFSYEGFYGKDDDILQYHCFLNVKKLFYFDKKQDLLILENYMNEKYNNYDIDSDYDYSTNWEAIEDENLPAYIFELGFDGYITNIENAVVVYNSNQIKLADGTNTTFDGNNPDIRFESGGGVLLAPNGKPSNLTPEQWHLVRTPEFKAWFGDWEKINGYNFSQKNNGSRVIEFNGLNDYKKDATYEPLVVYHTTYRDFNEFSLNAPRVNDVGFYGKGFYFGLDPLYLQKLYGGKAKPYFLNIQSPFIIDEFTPREFAKFFGVFVEDTITEENSEDLRNELIKKGYDGIIVTNGIWGKEIVAFYPNQIKLADGSNTTFDGNNPDIRFESGGEIDRSLARKKQEISFDDFHIATFANFKKIRQVDLPKREPDFVSKSGSKYWYEGDKVYRMSNHWGRIIASCNWLLDGFAVRGLSQGYCKLKDFHREMSFLLNDKNAGKRFLVGKTSFLRSGKGAIDISENEGVFIKETSDFYVFDTFKVSKITLAYVKPLQKVNYE